MILLVYVSLFNFVEASTCIGYRLEYLVNNNKIVMLFYPVNKSVTVNNLTIPLKYSPGNVENLTKPVNTKVVRDTGTRLLIYDNTIHFLARINNTLVDLYYDHDTRILVLASMNDEDLILLLSSKPVPYTCTPYTSTKSINNTTTHTTLHEYTTTTPHNTSHEVNINTDYLLPIVLVLLVITGITIVLLLHKQKR